MICFNCGEYWLDDFTISEKLREFEYFLPPIRICPKCGFVLDD